MKKIVFTGGGTAGHIIPNLSLISYLKNYEIHYIGSYGLEKEILSKYPHIHYYDITSCKLIRSLSLKNFAIPYKLFKGINDAKKILKQIKPDVIFSKGGYVSLPVVIAGKMLNIPIITHESDISMGLSNKIISKFANLTLCSFKDTTKNKSSKFIYTGPPLKPILKKGNKQNVPNISTLNPSKKTVLIFGGSLGATTINNLVYTNLDKLLKTYNILHITGKGKLNKDINKKGYIAVEYTHNIEDYFDACDYVVSRAGSNAIFELLALNKKAVLIPLSKSSRGEQVQNATYFYKQNLVEMLLEKDLNIDTLLIKLNNLHTLKNSNIDIDKTNLKIIRYIEKII